MSRTEPVPIQLWPATALGVSAPIVGAFVAGDPVDVAGSDTIEVWPASSVLGAPNAIKALEVQISGSADGSLFAVIDTVFMLIPAGAAPIAFPPIVRAVTGRFFRLAARDPDGASGNNRVTILGRRRGV